MFFFLNNTLIKNPFVCFVRICWLHKFRCVRAFIVMNCLSYVIVNVVIICIAIIVLDSPSRYRGSQVLQLEFQLSSSSRGQNASHTKIGSIIVMFIVYQNRHTPCIQGNSISYCLPLMPPTTTIILALTNMLEALFQKCFQPMCRKH